MGRVTDDGSTKNKPKGLNLNWRLNSIPAFVHDHLIPLSSNGSLDDRIGERRPHLSAKKK